MMLVSENVGGNVHAATEYANRMGLADYVLGMYPIGAAATVLVLRVPMRHPLAVKALADARAYADDQTRRSRGLVDVPAWGVPNTPSPRPDPAK